MSPQFLLLTWCRLFLRWLTKDLFFPTLLGENLNQDIQIVSCWSSGIFSFDFCLKMEKMLVLCILLILSLKFYDKEKLSSILSQGIYISGDFAIQSSPFITICFPVAILIELSEKIWKSNPEKLFTLFGTNDAYYVRVFNIQSVVFNQPQLLVKCQKTLDCSFLQWFCLACSTSVFFVAKLQHGAVRTFFQETVSNRSFFLTSRLRTTVHNLSIRNLFFRVSL